jgi:hypothetical protein
MIVGKLANSTIRASVNSFAAKSGFAALGSDRHGLSDWHNVRISNRCNRHAAFRYQILLVFVSLSAIFNCLLYVPHTH